MSRRRTGSVVRHRGMLRVVVTGDDGQRVWLTGKFPDTDEGRQAAEDFRDETRIERNRGTWESPRTVTVADYAPVFLDAKRLEVGATTIVGYTHSVDKHIVGRLGRRKLADLRPPDARKFYSDLLTDGGLAPKTVRNVGMLLRQMLTMALDDGLVPVNHVAAVKLPKATRPKIETRTADQTHRFITEADEPIRTLGVVFATTAMRRSELVGLTWDSVDLDAAVLTITGTVVNVDNVPTYRPADTKTSSSRRSVSLDPYTVDVLRTHRARQAAQQLLAEELWQPGDFVFTDKVGRFFSPDWVTRTFQAAARELGLRAIGTKGLRHSFATNALVLGVSPKVVADRLGHSTVVTTLQTYSHVLPETDREAAAKVAAAITGG